MNKFLKVMVTLMPFACIGLLFILFNVSNPVDIGPGGILIVFVLIYLFFMSSFFVILHFGVGLLGRFVSSRRSIDQRHWQVGVRRAYYIASALAFAPVVLLAMQSVGQLQARDVLLVTILEILAIFYIVKRAT
jgi:hypothetical protein